MNQLKPLFSVTDSNELLALWRLVAEAKFQSNPDDADLWRSPYVHRLAERISDAMLADYKAKGDQKKIDSHLLWLESLPNNLVYPIIKANLRRDSSEKWWLEMSQHEKVAYVRGCVAPFMVSDTLLEGLIFDAMSQ